MATSKERTASSANERDVPALPTSELADVIADAAFLRVFAPPDGDALAAAGMLLRAASDRSVPVQARVRRWPRAGPTDGHGGSVTDGGSSEGAGASTVADPPVLELDGAGGPSTYRLDRVERPASLAAFEVARALDADPAPAIALAGATAAGRRVEDDDLTSVRSALDPVRASGLATPSTDPVDGLAHSGLLFGPFSGDRERAAGVLGMSENTSGEPIGEDESDHGPSDGAAGRTDHDLDPTVVASIAAVEAVSAPAASPRSAAAIERAVRPHQLEAGPVPTVEGLGDVFELAAGTDPGAAIALAAGFATAEEAVAAWRTAARRVHGAVREATIAADADADDEPGTVVYDVPGDAVGPSRSVARLLRDFRAPMGVELVAARHDGQLALAATTAVRPQLGAVINALRSLDVDGSTAAMVAPDGTALVRFETAPTASAIRDAIRGVTAA